MSQTETAKHYRLIEESATRPDGTLPTLAGITEAVANALSGYEHPIDGEEVWFGGYDGMDADPACADGTHSTVIEDRDGRILARVRIAVTVESAS